MHGAPLFFVVTFRVHLMNLFLLPRRPGLPSLRSLGTRLTLAAVACCIASVGVTCLAVGWKGSEMSEAAVRREALLQAQRAAKDVQAVFLQAQQATRTLAEAMATAQRKRAPWSREQVSLSLRSTLEANPTWLAVYANWEPGQIGPPPDRFAPYWTRESGGAELQAADAHPQPDAPLLRQGSPVLMEPYLLDKGAQRTLVTSIVAPIPGEDGPAGVVGVDCVLAGLQMVLAEVKTFDGARLALVSAAGRYVTHPDETRIGRSADDLPPALRAALQQGRSAEAHWQGTMHLLEPMPLGDGQPPWFVAIAYPDSHALAASRQLVRWSLFAGLACAAFAALVLVVWLARLMRPVRQLASTIEALSAGESSLDVRLPMQGQDEVGRVAQAFNRFVGRLGSAFGAVRGATADVKSIAGDVAASSRSLALRTEQQAAGLEQIVATIEQIRATVRSNAAESLDAARRSQAVMDAGAACITVVNDTQAAMVDIRQVNQRIDEISVTIDALASQTALLSLNAAVEAARAGAAGRGFAVLSAEVRELAARTTDAAAAIRRLNDDSVRRLSAGEALMRKTGDAVGGLVQAIGSVHALTCSVSSASQEQAAGIEQIATAVAHLDEMTQHNAGMVQQAAGIADALQERSTAVAAALERFG